MARDKAKFNQLVATKRGETLRCWWRISGISPILSS